MEIIKVNLNNVSEIVPKILSEQKEAFVYCIADESCAVVGSNGYNDLNNIQKANIKCIQIKHEGGTIILSPGDIDIGIFTKGYYGRDIRDNIINKIIVLLKEKGYNASVINNDILINNKKVVGFGSRMFGDILYTAIHISINIDINLIKKICTKPMNKIPDGLVNYGINTEDILNNVIPEVFDIKI